jgi:predicted regulator of Ras-like GTPase activity (Roadblock/LC7/MglB family)
MAYRERTRRKMTGTTTGDLVLFGDEVLKAMDEALHILVEETGARCAFVMDRTGVVLASVGDFHPTGPETMGATAAGVIAALNSMVGRTTNTEMSVKVYSSEIDKIHFSVVIDRLVLCILQTRQTTTGTVRTASRTFAQSITPLLVTEQDTSDDTQRVVKSVRYIESKLDDIFKELL